MRLRYFYLGKMSYKKRLLSIILIIFTLVFMGCNSPPITTPDILLSDNSIFEITFAEKKMLPGVSILVYGHQECQESNLIGEPLTTDSTGEATMSLPSGEYWFIATHSGYLSYQGTFKIENGNIKVSFRLEAIDEQGSVPGFDYIIIYSDPHNSSNHQQLVAYISGNFNPEAVFITGDLVFNGYSESEWDTFSASIVNYACPVYPALGNHEYYNLFNLYFISKKPSAFYFNNAYLTFPFNENDNYYYSLNISLDEYIIHFIVLNTNETVGNNLYSKFLFIGDISANQFNWLETDLLKNSSADFIVCLFHHPIYSSGGFGPSTALQTKLVPLFEKSSVDMVFYGHDHSYERTTINGIHYVQTCGGKPHDRNDSNFCKLFINNGNLSGVVYDIFGNELDRFEQKDRTSNNGRLSLLKTKIHEKHETENRQAVLRPLFDCSTE